MDELLQQFVVEASELVQSCADDLLALEREPSSKPHIESLFRSVHTLKGSVGLFDFAPLQRTLFAAEDVLTAANRSGELDGSLVDPLMAIVEWTERCVGHVAQHGNLPEGAAPEGQRLADGLKIGGAAAHAPSSTELPDWARLAFERHPEAQTAILYAPRPDCFFSGDDPTAIMEAVPDLLDLAVVPRQPWPALAEFDPFTCNLSFEAVSSAPLTRVAPLFRLIPDQSTLCARPAAGGAPVPSSPTQGGARRMIRVDAERIDALSDIVGELFVAKNAMQELARQARQLAGGGELGRAIAALNEDIERLTVRLQDAASSARMVPMGDTLRRLPRLVREVSAQLGKPVDLTIEGENVETDKAVVDALFDPLLHLVRNAIGHGIEAASLRAERGKPARGRIRIAARQVGYRIEVIVEDDGGGVDVEHVRATAVARGLITADEGASLDQAAIIELLFRSGFSTAAKVDDVSGRGVGMDAVRREVLKLGGRISLESEAGKGTTARISVPTAFSVARILIVTSHGERYGIPMDLIAETGRVAAREIVPVRAGEAVVLRDRTVPLVRLGALLGRPTRQRDEELLLIAEFGGTRVALAIDAIGERLETVVRPAAGILKTVPVISGTIVLGNGDIVVVLEVEALLE